MADRIVQLEDSNGDKIYPVSVLPDGQAYIEVTSTDPGEGSALAENHFVAVTSGTSLLDMFYPVGSYYETSNTSFNPNTAWGGTWQEDSTGRVTVAQDTGTFDTVGDTGGEETHTLTVAEMPKHNHEINIQKSGTGDWWSLQSFNIERNPQGGYSTNDTGGNQAHNNLQPYIVVKRWHRVA